MLALNGLLLLATPAYGSHYVVDVIAGIAVAAACWVAVAPFFGASEAPPLTAIQQSPSIVPDALPAPTVAARLQKFESA